MKRLMLAVAALVLVTAAAPRRGMIPSIGETIEVNIVNVDVVVTDRQGNRVRGLTKDDFLILDNGRPREISNFAEYTSGEAGSVGVRDGEPAPVQPRTVLLFLERNKLQPFDADRMVESIREAARSTIRRGDAMGVVVWSPVKQVRVDFTDDMQKIEKMLDTLKKDFTGPQRDTPAELVADVDAIMNFEEEIAARALEFDMPYVMTDRSVVVEHVGAMESLSELTRMKRKVDAINASINTMASAEGRKILLLGTHRLGEIAGGEFYYEAGEEFLSREVRDRHSTRNLIDSIVTNANAAGVTIYPFYPAGRPNKATANGSEYLTVMNEMESLTRLARQTGGVEASGAAEVVTLLRRVEDDISDYYSLAYRIDSKRGDRNRDVLVKAKNPAYVVRARRGYVEKSDETRMRDRLTAAMVRTTPDSMFQIEAQVGDAKNQKRTTETLPLQVKIPIGALTLVPENGTNVGAFSVFVVAGSGADDVSTVRKQTQGFEIPPADLAKAMTGHFTYDLDLVVDGKADRVAIGVLDELSKSYAVLRVPVK